MQIVPNHCFDGEKNKSESGTDCGGACPRKCGEHEPDFMIITAVANSTGCLSWKRFEQQRNGKLLSWSSRLSQCRTNLEKPPQ